MFKLSQIALETIIFLHVECRYIQKARKCELFGDFSLISP
ncbi:hypothetical protein [Vibrio vulnificus YJ016]|uniref:Uncharacterized protein n=1 Tax=Vibrio vulnificus (strain YJ016) TaxID=196600 RepID=Q7MMR6_VIBVY|nr:hypothetical protein VVMO6_02225 [Vibrio vulnificus MO6-24/O]BAC93765.1 hypothetical protein [Vibrio vulnificus YJ016]